MVITYGPKESMAVEPEAVARISTHHVLCCRGWLVLWGWCFAFIPGVIAPPMAPAILGKWYWCVLLTVIVTTVVPSTVVVVPLIVSVVVIVPSTIVIIPLII